MSAALPIPLKKRRVALTLSSAAFRRWLRVARKGDAAIYHVGALASEISDPRAHALRGHRDFVRWAQAEGHVILAQRRGQNIDGFEYLAIRTALLLDDRGAA